MIVHDWSADTDDAPAQGERFGAAWQTQLREALGTYEHLFASSRVSSATVGRVVDGARAATEEHAPAIARELRGIAAGSGLTVAETYMLTARTEILATATASMECSTIVHVPRDGTPPRTLQTWDWHDTVSNETVVRRIRSHTGARVLTFHEFGQPAKIGVNDRGLGLHFNILNHAADGVGDGVPVHVLARMILDEAADLADAGAIARRVPLSASSVLTVVSVAGGRAQAASIEVSPAGVAVLGPDESGTLVHTNHFLDPTLAAREHAPDNASSLPRLRCLADAADLARIENPLERALAFGALPDAPISQRADEAKPANQRWETKLTIALDVARPAVEFAAASPADVSRAEWRRIDLASTPARP